MRVPSALTEQLRRAKHIAVTAHANPEGDALGSALALALGLQTLGKRAQVIFRHGFPHRYRALPHAHQVRRNVAAPVDLLVVVDCADLDRADLPNRWKRPRVPLVVIDHHPKRPPAEAVAAWVEPQAAATGELIAALLRTLKVPLNRDIATCLYAAILTDTGGFHFRNTNARVLRLAAALLGYGVDPQTLYDQLLETRSLRATRLLARMLAQARLEDKIGLCWAALSRADFRDTGTTDDDTENFVNFLRAVDGTRVAVLFREVAPDLVKVSLRAKDDKNVAAVAQQFGGGGHPAAAGCRLRCPLDWAVRQVLAALRRVLAQR